MSYLFFSNFTLNFSISVSISVLNFFASVSAFANLFIFSTASFKDSKALLISNSVTFSIFASSLSVGSVPLVVK